MLGSITYSHELTTTVYLSTSFERQICFISPVLPISFNNFETLSSSKSAVPERFFYIIFKAPRVTFDGPQ